MKRFKYKSFGHFLDELHLNRNSTEEIRRYCEFIEKKRKENGCTRETRLIGMEKHHILPISFGGINHPKNYVNLTRLDHMIAHKLLNQLVHSSNRFPEEIRKKTSRVRRKTILDAFLNPIRRQLPKLEYFP